MSIPDMIFGGETGLSKEALARKRAMANRMAAGATRAPANVGQGLTAIGQALAYRMLENGMNKDENSRIGKGGAMAHLMRAKIDPQSKQARDLPHYRRGTNSHPGGMAVVGEDGPEVVHLPPGSKVDPNLVTRAKGLTPEEEVHIRSLPPQEAELALKAIEAGNSATGLSGKWRKGINRTQGNIQGMYDTLQDDRGIDGPQPGGEYPHMYGNVADQGNLWKMLQAEKSSYERNAPAMSGIGDSPGVRSMRFNGGEMPNPGQSEETFNPDMIDPRGMFFEEDAKVAPGSSFTPGAEYQTADMSNLGPSGVGEETQLHKSARAYQTLMKGLDEYEKIFADGGSTMWPGAQKDRLDTAHRDLQMQMKELYNLGVLNGPDLGLMNQILLSPTSIGGNLMDTFGIADMEQRIPDNVTQVRRMMTNLVEPGLQQLGMTPADLRPKAESDADFLKRLGLN